MWSDNETQTMIDWMGTSSEEFKEFENLEELVVPMVIKLKNLPDVNSSVYAEFQKKADQFGAFVNCTIESISIELAAISTSINLFEYLQIDTSYSTSEAGSQSDATSTERSDEGSITQKSVGSTVELGLPDRVVLFRKLGTS